MEAFEKSQQDSFEARVAQRLSQHFEKCRLMEAGAFQALIRRGIHQANAWGFSSARDVSRFLGLVVVLGEDFDQGERHAWARQILEEKGLGPSQKLDRLYARARQEER